MSGQSVAGGESGAGQFLDEGTPVAVDQRASVPHELYVVRPVVPDEPIEVLQGGDGLAGQDTCPFRGAEVLAAVVLSAAWRHPAIGG